MKIPVYKNKVVYQGSFARSVPLARPLKEASGHQHWFDLHKVGQQWKAVAQTYQQATNLLEKNKYSKQSKTEKTEKNAISENPAKQRVFSSDQRKELFDFYQKNLFPAENEKDSSSVEKLDQYAESHSSGLETDFLASQDYVVMRRHALEQEQKKYAQAHQMRLVQGRQIFLQVASAVRGVAALEEYIQNNLSAASQENGSESMSEIAWKETQQTLRQEAVLKNIHTSLQEGLVSQAEEVFHHFLNEIPEEKAAVLSSKISYKKAELQVASLPKSIYQQMEKEQDFSAKRMESFIQDIKPETEDKDIFWQVFSAHVAERKRAYFADRANLYKKLFSQRNSSMIIDFEVDKLGKESFDKLQKASLRMAEEGSFTNPVVFNSLYEKVLEGKAEEKEIELSFEKNQLTAKEYFLLQHKFCQKQAGERVSDEVFLKQAVEQLVQEQAKADSQRQALKYSIYTSGINCEDALATAQRARQILRLQEVEK